MISARIVLWLMLYAAIFCNTFVTNNLNIAIVSMVKYSEIVTENETRICYDDWAPSNATIHVRKANSYLASSQSTFDWNENDRGIVLGAFNTLSWISQFFGGFLAHKYGAKKVVGWSTFIACLVSSLIPPAAFISPRLVAAVRMIQGIILSFGLPVGIFAFAGRWCPPHERGKFLTVTTAYSFGTAGTLSVCGYIADIVGWPYVFYLTSVLGILWFVGWQYCVYDSPDKHPRISTREKLYIQNGLGSTIAKQKLPIPWKSISTSMPFLINIICQIGATWSRYVFLLYLPSYFKVIHGLNHRDNGLLSGTPYILRAVFSITWAMLVDFLLAKGILSKTGNRNLVTYFSSIIAGLLLLGVAFAYCSTYQAIIFVCLSVGLSGGFTVGSVAACIDMSPNLSGVLSGIATSISMIFGSLSPFFVAFLAFVYEGDPMEQWKMVWLLTGGLSALTGLIFVVWSDSELQPWNEVYREANTDKMLLEKTVNNS